MGCCNSKKDKLKNASIGIEEINIESQEKELINILTEVNKKIDNLKNEVINIFLFRIYLILFSIDEIKKLSFKSTISHKLFIILSNLSSF